MHKWYAYVSSLDSDQQYPHVRWELEAGGMPHPEPGHTGETCDIYSLTLIEDDIPGHVRAYIELTERALEADRCVEFWQESPDREEWA